MESDCPTPFPENLRSATNRREMSQQRRRRNCIELRKNGRVYSKNSRRTLIFTELPVLQPNPNSSDSWRRNFRNHLPEDGCGESGDTCVRGEMHKQWFGRCLRNDSPYCFITQISNCVSNHLHILALKNPGDWQIDKKIKTKTWLSDPIPCKKHGVIILHHAFSQFQFEVCSWFNILWFNPMWFIFTK